LFETVEQEACRPITVLRLLPYSRLQLFSRY